MKKLSNISETYWSRMNRRSQGTLARKEDGKKVNTCLGIPAFLRDPNCKYDELISYLTGEGGYDNNEFVINNPKDMNWSPEKLSDIKNWNDPYTYMIYNPGHGMDLSVSFTEFEVIRKYGRLDDLYEFSEEDYISICRCIATKLKDVGDSIKYVKNDHFVIDKNDGFYDEYALQLIDEASTYYWYCENDYNYYWKLFKDDMVEQFPELEDVYFTCWTYNDGVNIAIPLYPKEMIINFPQYKEFAKNWFKI